MKGGLENEYFDWMYRLVYADAKGPSYRKLLRHLHDVPFRYAVAMDGNRAEDGINLRYRFGDERGIADSIIASCLDGRECSVLEMMAALAVRCEEHIMDDPDIGDRTGVWFREMVESLGLGGMTDGRYDRGLVRERLDRFLDREYGRDGRGGLFTVVRYDHIDMRSKEIWYQAMWHFDEVLKS